MSEAEGVTTLTREELYALIWAAPLKNVAERFGTSGQHLSRLCDAFDIARPDQGHWTRIELGKPVTIHALQPPRAGLPDRIEIVAKPAKASAEPTRRDLDRPSVQALAVRERLVRPHPIVAEWIALREKQGRSQDQVYDGRLKRLVKPGPPTAADRRRWLLADAIFKAVEKQSVSVGEGERRTLFMAFGGERIEFQIRYRLRRGQRPLTTDEMRWRDPGAQDWKYELHETESLIFEIKAWLPGGLRTEWEDSKRGTLEDQSGDIVVGILAAFPVLAELRRQREEEKRQHERAARERQQREDARKLDQARFRKLLEHVGNWREAGLARAFLSALREAMPSDSPAVAGIETNDWLAWAERKIAEHDLLTSDPRAIFESIATVTSTTYRGT